MLWLPAGSVIFQEFVSSSQWLPIPEAKRGELQDQLAA